LVTIAYWLFLLAALAHIVGLIITAITYNGSTAATKSQLAHNSSGISSSQVNAALSAGLVIGIVLGILYAAAFVVFAIFMRRGANWARIVLLILTVITLTGIAGAYGVGAVGVVAAVVATVLTFLPPANTYFRSVKAARGGLQNPGAYPPPMQ
jgi:K+-sensing histidine kinase KdpD